MALDFIVITIAILLFIRGYKKGIIVAAFSVLAILLGVACALSLSGRLSVYLFEKGIATTAWAPFISYLLLFILVVWIVRLLAKLLEKSTETVLLGWVNRSIGGLLYAFVGVVIWSSLIWLFNRAHMLSPETIVQSRTYKYVMPVAPWIFDHIGQVLPFAKDVFGEMRHFFDDVNRQLPDHVGTH